MALLGRYLKCLTIPLNKEEKILKDIAKGLLLTRGIWHVQSMGNQ